MEEKGLSLVAASATKKVAYSKNIPQYFIYSAMAGACCALGMALAYSVGSSFYFNSPTAGMSSLIMGITFALSFTLIVFSGAELFTGNMMTIRLEPSLVRSP